MSQKVLSYDLGGTKVAAGVVNSKGRILEKVRAPVDFQKGKDAVIRQLCELGNPLLAKYPEIKQVGIASAGPLDPIRGILLDPTNFAGPEGTWGQVYFTRVLRNKLKRAVFLENDAAAAILAEHWIGAAKKTKNAMILTLGTGLGTGIICNGALVRAGRNLHTEGGHTIIQGVPPAQNSLVPVCGCGNPGCAEAYLSGKNFETFAARLLQEPSLTAAETAARARRKNPPALAAFEEYARWMAIAIHNYVRLFSPEVIVFSGSFAATADLFIPSTLKYLENLLKRQREGIDLLPELKVSSLGNDAGLIGGAYVAFHREGKIRAPKKASKKVFKKESSRLRPKRRA